MLVERSDQLIGLLKTHVIVESKELIETLFPNRHGKDVVEHIGKSEILPVLVEIEVEMVVEQRLKEIV